MPAIAIAAALAGGAYAQSEAPAAPMANMPMVAPTNDAPNPYRTIEGWAKLPAGRKWGSTSAIDIDRDGKTVWVAERCGANSCLDRETNQVKPIDPIIHLDENGNVIKMFGGGMLVAPHGIYVDQHDNIWVTDYQDNAPAPAGGGRGRGAAGAGSGAGRGAGGGRAAAPAGPIGPRPGATVGHQVFEFSKDGKLLMTLGPKGGAAEPDPFFAPNDVIVANGRDHLRFGRPRRGQ